ncbi:MAG: Ig-like domain-containing protein [Bacteroidales bacterium]|jgi:hypothetical protein|nr:Ig-like domain-containing protein [Bacteroidales bacterium]
MKKSLVTILISALFLASSSFQDSLGQVALPHYDGMNYAVGSSLQTQTGWTAVNSGDDIVVTEGNLNFVGLTNSIGNKILFNGSGIDASKSITSQTAGTVYLSFIMKVTNVTAATEVVGGYFAGFGQNSTTFGATIWLKKNGENFNIGINPRTTTSMTGFSSGTYSINTEIFIVASYQFNGSTGDDVAKIWINPAPSTFGSVSEPAADITVTNTGGTDLTGISTIFVRQDSDTETPFIQIDEFRISINWADATPADVTAPSASFNPLNSATDVAINTTPTITFDEAVVKADGSELTDGDLTGPTGLVTLKKTNASGDDVSFTGTIDAAKKVITITPSAPLDNSQLYYLAISAVKDASGNQSTASEITFTTIAAAAPTVTLTNPVGGETFYATDPVTFTWTSENITNVLLEVFVPRANEWQSMGIPIPAVAGKLDFVIPSDAPYGTEYKIRISDAGNSAVNSTSGSFTVIAFATSLTELRANCIPNDIVKLSSEATVTFLRTNRYQKYIQDSGKGLLIDDGAHILTTTLAPGDNITGLEGKLGLYHGLLQLVPTKTTVTIASSGNIVTPTQMTIADYNTNYLNYESMLIKLTNVTFAAGNGTATFAAATNYIINDGANSVTFRTFNADETDIDGEIIPNAPINMTCIAGFYDATIQVYSRTKSDFELITAIERTSDFKAEIYPVPAADMLKVRNLKDIKAYEILDATGRTISKLKVAADSELNIPVSELKHGIYYIRFNTASGIVVKKFVK